MPRAAAPGKQLKSPGLRSRHAQCVQLPPRLATIVPAERVIAVVNTPALGLFYACTDDLCGLTMSCALQHIAPDHRHNYNLAFVPAVVFGATHCGLL